MTTGSPIVVVDTDVVSFIFKGDTRGVLYRSHLDGQLAIIARRRARNLNSGLCFANGVSVAALPYGRI